MRITTEDSYFIVDGVRIRSRKGRTPRRRAVGLRFSAVALPRSAISAVAELRSSLTYNCVGLRVRTCRRSVSVAAERVSTRFASTCFAGQRRTWQSAAVQCSLLPKPSACTRVATTAVTKQLAYSCSANGYPIKLITRMQTKAA